ncbi:stage II sporulation protein M [uncultured Oscillibacter sp.]|uniref:stage II sporulation protein M n=1 Tax=uncultured Oscillibacter sp. TaxID=876091 RepID=UPI0025F271A7|nr:stage II sporulation protein M [uncultured Oscillibacter sp.]
MSLSRLLFLALFFLAGVLLGQVLAGKVPDGTGGELTRYLTDYVYLYGQTAPESRAFWETVVIYFRYPLLAVFLGFTSVGVVLVPVVAAAFGFFLSFSVSCFTAAFGGEGVLLALAVSGLRCAVTLPCFFLLAVPSWQASWTLASLSLGRGQRTAPVVYGRVWWLRAGLAAAVLLAGVCADHALSPVLLRLALERVLS